MGDLKEARELVDILLFLLPGFLTSKIVQLLVVTKPKETFDKIVEAFVFTFLNLVCFSIVRWLFELIPSVRFGDKLFAPANLFVMLLCAVGIGVLCSAELTNESVLERIRRLGTTKKTYKPCTWIETFAHTEKFIVVHLEDGRRIYGWPRFYSDEASERAIFLENASWLSDENQLLNDPPISIFLDEKSGIQLIEFLPYA